MQENTKPNSYLNQRSNVPIKQEDTLCGVQTETLTRASVKITSDLAAFANPYAILTNEFTETKTRVSVSFVIDPAELAKNEVKLPQTIKDEPVETVVEEVKEEKPRAKSAKEAPLPEIPAVETAPKAPQMSDMEALNRLAEFQNVPTSADEKPAMNFDVPKDAELLKPKEENVSNDLEVLNELQAEETDTKKSKNTKQEINATMNGLEGLLAELSEDEGTKTLGLG